MKPTVHILHKAAFSQRPSGTWFKVCAQFTVNGNVFTSEAPASVAEAIEINTAIERLVEAVKP